MDNRKASILARPHKTIQPSQAFEPGQIKDIVLSVIGLSVLVGGIIITPTFPIILGAILNLIKKEHNIDIPQDKVIRTLRQLEKAKLVQLEHKDDNILVTIDKRGRPLIKKYSVRSLLKLKRQDKSWGGKWYLVVFDVPEVQSNKRLHLRRILKWVGFYPYQKSVFAFPYECRAEVSLLRDLVESKGYTKYIVADKIDDEDKLKRHFNLK